jgi:hypothetical protein
MRVRMHQVCTYVRVYACMQVCMFIETPGTLPANPTDLRTQPSACPSEVAKWRERKRERARERETSETERSRARARAQQGVNVL